METRIVKCPCGNRFQTPLHTLGAWMRCPACQTELCISANNSQPRQDIEKIESLWGDSEEDQAAWEAEPSVARELEAAQHRNARAQCARCGKDFQGLWDRYETDQGYWCHRCHNRFENRASRKTRVVPPMIELPRPVIREAAFEEKRDHMERVRGTLFMLALGAVCIAVIAILPVEEWIARLLVGGYETKKLPTPDSPFWPFAEFLVGWLTDFIVSAAVLMIMLTFIGTLPAEDWQMNLLFVAGVGGIMLLIHVPSIAFPAWPGPLLSLGFVTFMLIEKFEAEPRHLALFALLSIIGILARMLLTLGLTGLAAALPL